MTDSEIPADALERSAIVLPDFKKWSSSSIYNYDEEIVDYEKLEDLNRTINQARIALFKTTDAINKHEREEKKAKLNYDRAWRREFIRTVAKTERERAAKADLKCEDLENEHFMYQQLREELVRLSHTLRLELQTLQALGNNLRQQMKVL